MPQGKEKLLPFRPQVPPPMLPPRNTAEVVERMADLMLQVVTGDRPETAGKEVADEVLR